MKNWPKSAGRLLAYLRERIAEQEGSAIELGSKQIGGKIGMPPRTVRWAVQWLHQHGAIELQRRVYQRGYEAAYVFGLPRGTCNSTISRVRRRVLHAGTGYERREYYNKSGRFGIEHWYPKPRVDRVARSGENLATPESGGLAHSSLSSTIGVSRGVAIRRHWYRVDRICLGYWDVRIQGKRAYMLLSADQLPAYRDCQ
jgi:hypothetical protein